MFRNDMKGRDGQHHDLCASFRSLVEVFQCVWPLWGLCAPLSLSTMDTPNWTKHRSYLSNSLRFCCHQLSFPSASSRSVTARLWASSPSSAAMCATVGPRFASPSLLSVCSSEEAVASACHIH